MADSTTTKEGSLPELLSQALPKDSQFTFYHVSSPPTKCAAIFSAPPGARPERTYCESHFLNVSIKPKPGDERSTGEVLAFAIEVLIYTTSHLTTIFVSKADSTGYISLLNLPRTQTSPLRAISSAFISWLVKHRQRPGVRLVVSLFARAQDQYLFPGSVENGDKHIADDTALIKWWCKVLDPVLRDYAPEVSETGQGSLLDRQSDRTTAQGHLVIPGLEKNDTIRFFPATVRSDLAESKRWRHGHPLQQISKHPSAPPRCLIPHFPDDPKSRYMDELDDELPETGAQSLTSPSKGNGQWRSVRSLEQFWEMMSFRQECSSGRLVGFIWVIFTPPDLDDMAEDEFPGSQTESIAEMLSPPNKFNEASEMKNRPRRRSRLTGPIVPRVPRIKSGSSKSPDKLPPVESRYYAWPASSRGQIVLEEKDYKRATDLLLHQNYANREMAVVSTKKWIDEASVLGCTQRWGMAITGRKAAPAVETNGNGGVNMLNASMLRKKRKPEGEESAPKTAEAVNTLPAGLVRKKAKATEESPSAAGSAEGVNVLGAGLIRRKPKA
ncbi:uncharacterized protein K452DRAFT_327616 [Aplosporella prunicola CBS 121167]|uniref:histone acetyltransferase n=1 Tax=Aplosporella prunicola CBS 121167 TaxID=1176127 RepID=A0A6A6B7U9_9PEZI|nr:uncharacterized protein K452DRAFT_327616 [Aplosporella prunicola CBS 121167]KAF2140209.1 hypothetical protein K452DRAFT_327616 [Aplosporella prunicola CBS 121167]